MAVKHLDTLLHLVRGGPRSLRPKGELTILAIGPFYSENWVAAQLHALGRTPEFAEVTVITPEEYGPLPGVRYEVPSQRIRRFTGMSIARALTALSLAIRQKPDVIIGYHAPWNGMVGLLLGRLVKARTAYFSVGGPAEIVGGGLYSEHALFRRLGAESPRLENRFLELINRFDSVLTMGSGSARWFRARGVTKPVWPMGASVDGESFGSEPAATSDMTKRWDLVSVARLAPIKRLDLLIETVALLKQDFPRIQAVIVGDGADRDRLERTRRDKLVENQVTLAGFQSDVVSYLRASRIFVMTSAAEGLPLALIEAMLCGLPVVAPAIGDIEDLVRHGENGYLFSPGDVAGCSDWIRNLLASSDLEAMGQAARAGARAYTVEGRVNLWSSWVNTLTEPRPDLLGS